MADEGEGDRGGEGRDDRREGKKKESRVKTEKVTRTTVVLKLLGPV